MKDDEMLPHMKHGRSGLYSHQWFIKNFCKRNVIEVRNNLLSFALSSLQASSARWWATCP